MQDITRAAAPDDVKHTWRLAAVLLGVALTAIAVTCTLTVRSLARLVYSQTAVTQALLVDSTLKELLVDMLNAETGERGFMLTGRATYLQPYYEGLAQLLKSRDVLAVAVSQEPAAAREFGVLNRAIVANLEVLTHAVDLKSQGHPEEADEDQLTARGKQTMDAVRDAVRALAADEGRRVEQQRAVHAQEIRNTYWTLGGSITLNVLLLAGLVQRMRHTAAQGHAARQAMAARNDELSRLLEATAARKGQVHALAELSRFLQSCRDMEEAGQLLRQQLPLLLRAGGGSLYLFAASRNQLRQTFSWGAEPFAEYLEPGNCWALRLGQPYRQPTLPGAAACEHLQGVQPSARVHMRCLPLVAHGDLLGLLVVDTGVAVDLPVRTQDPAAPLAGPQDPAAHTQDPAAPPVRTQDPAADDEYHRMTLEQVALSIGNLKLRESLHQQSIRDVLTGLYNRRFLEESALHELQRATRLLAAGGHHGVALLMIDVDHFKRFNDQHGHEVGDQVLCEVGRILQRATRDSDVAARYGGEEFTIVMADVPPAVAQERAERIREDVERMAVGALAMAVGTVTISIGMAQFPVHGGTLDALFLAADKALYAAKRAGRNRVMIAALPGEPGSIPAMPAA